ncbi:hypothetical protein BKA64DRAFT_680927 [Cadophora sp. MPI-SDFR-AT-0126]|nr:hypothetical protein BKA64DRAFT_680927 [Leotiomycetes sp. MPI-SDFR-AT-0126]
MKNSIFSTMALFAATTLSLTIPGILPDPNSLPDTTVRDPSSLRLGCIASLGIGFLFGSLFLVWVGLIIYHSIASLFRPRDNDEEQVLIDKSVASDAEKSEEEEKKKKTWKDSYGAGPVLGTIFGVTLGFGVCCFCGIWWMRLRFWGRFEVMVGWG